jgi:hypothetical protein
MKTLKSFVLCAVALFCVTCVAQEFKTAPAKKALKDYQVELKRLEGLYQQVVEKAQKKYEEDLESARKSALIHNNLDEAQRIIGAQKAIAKGVQPKSQPASQPQPAPKGEWIVGTEWQINKTETMKWGENVYQHFVNGNPSSVSWFMIGDNEVIAVGKMGGKFRVALWQFAPNKKTAKYIRCDQNYVQPAARQIKGK